MSTSTSAPVWFVKSQSGVKGPFSSAQIAAFARNGKLPREALVATCDSGPWHPAKSIKGLSFPLDSTAGSAPTSNGGNRPDEVANPSQYDDEDPDAAFLSILAATSASAAASPLSDSQPSLEPDRKRITLPTLFAIGGVVALVALGVAIYLVDAVLTKNRIARERADFATAIAAATSAVGSDLEIAKTQYAQFTTSPYAADERDSLSQLAKLVAQQEAKQEEDRRRKKQAPLWDTVNKSLDALAMSPDARQLTVVRDALNAIISEPVGPWHPESQKLLEDLAVAENPILETNEAVLALIPGARECSPFAKPLLVPQELRGRKGNEMAEYARRELSRPSDYFRPFLKKHISILEEHLIKAEALKAKHGDFKADALELGGLLEDKYPPALRAVRLDKLLIAMGDAKLVLETTVAEIEARQRLKESRSVAADVRQANWGDSMQTVVDTTDDKVAPSNHPAQIPGSTSLSGTATIDGQSFQVGYTFFDDRLVEVTIHSVWGTADDDNHPNPYSAKVHPNSNRDAYWNPYSTYLKLKVLLDAKYGQSRQVTAIEDRKFVGDVLIDWSFKRPFGETNMHDRWDTTKHEINLYAMTRERLRNCTLCYAGKTAEQGAYNKVRNNKQAETDAANRDKTQKTLNGL